MSLSCNCSASRFIALSFAKVSGMSRFGSWIFSFMPVVVVLLWCCCGVVVVVLLSLIMYLPSLRLADSLPDLM